MINYWDRLFGQDSNQQLSTAAQDFSLGIPENMAAQGISTSMAPDGWSAWCLNPPPKEVLIETRRTYSTLLGNLGTVLLYVEDLDPETNIANLYWRITGIGKMQLEAQ